MHFNLAQDEAKNYTLILGSTLGGLQLDLMDLKETSVGTYVKLVCDGQLALTLV